MEGQRTGQEAAAGRQGACAHGHTARKERGKQASPHASTHARRAGRHTRKRTVSEGARRRHDTRAANGTQTSPQLHSTAVCGRTHLRTCSATIPVPTLPVSHPSSLLPFRTSRLLPEWACCDVVELSFFFSPKGATAVFCGKHHVRLRQATPGAPPLAGARDIQDAHSGARAVVLSCFGSI